MRDPIRPTPSSLPGAQAFARRGPGLVLAAHRRETAEEAYGALRALSKEPGVAPRLETVRAALRRLRELEAGRGERRTGRPRRVPLGQGAERGLPLPPVRRAGHGDKATRRGASAGCGRRPLSPQPASGGRFRGRPPLLFGARFHASTLARL